MGTNTIARGKSNLKKRKRGPGKGGKGESIGKRVKWVFVSSLREWRRRGKGRRNPLAKGGDNAELKKMRPHKPKGRDNPSFRVVVKGGKKGHKNVGGTISTDFVGAQR